MLEAYLVLPAFYLLYFLASPVSWRRRFVHLGAATVVLAVVSLSWAVVVDLTPADQRPYVGSSSNNSVLDLAFGYNGANRLLGREGAPGGGQGQSAPENNAQEGPPQGGGFGPGGAGENGDPGPFRLLDEQLAGQIGWLLPLAMGGLLAASWQNRPQLPINQQNQGLPLWRRWRSRLVFSFKNLPQLSVDRQQGALVLWGMWMLTMVIFFSIAGQFHRYYMVMLAPAVAALVGAGVVAFWRDYRRQGRRGWLLPLTLLGMAALQAYIILAYYDEDWSHWLTAVVVGLCLVAAVALVVLRLRPRLNVSVYAAGMVAVGVLALLIAPTVWAAYTAWQGSGRMAAAGPQTVQGSSRGGPGGGPRGGPWGGRDAADPVLMDYLQANRGDARYLVATTNARSAAPIVLNTDEPTPVIALGGFAGRDPVLTTDELAGLVDEGAVRFFLVQDRERMREMMANEDDSSQQPGQQGPPQGFPGGGRGFPQNEATSWVQDNCEEIPQELWQSPEAEEQGGGGPQMRRAQALYDCAPVRA
jgi:4-amino-4-deoxy-L-arabinose transferase-like glycosyltransferase